jgi:hypothetical protein
VKDQKLATQKLFEALSQVKELTFLAEICSNFIEHVEFQRTLHTSKALFNPDLTESYLAQALSLPHYLNKELLIYLILRDSKLFEVKNDLSKI